MCPAEALTGVQGNSTTLPVYGTFNTNGMTQSAQLKALFSLATLSCIQVWPLDILYGTHILMVDSTVKVALLEERSFLFWRPVLALAPKTKARVYMDVLGPQT